MAEPPPVDFDPDPARWAAALRGYLLSCETTYRTLDNDEARRRYATLTLGGLLERLERVPGLKGLGQLHSCRDVLDFFDDVHRGRDHPWRSLGPFGGLQQYTKDEERIRAHALVGVEMLIDAAGSRRGAKKQAFKHVAKLATAAGYELSAARVKGLYYEFKAGRFPHPELVAVTVAGFWMGHAVGREIALCEHGHPVHQCGDSGGERCAAIYKAAELYAPGLFIRL